MKFIIGNKIFDTNKAEFVESYKRQNYFRGMFEEIELYRKNNRWFEVNVARLECSEIEEKRVKEILKRLNKIEEYEKYFGKLEEI